MKKECAIIIMGVVVASMGAAATAVRRARGGGREAEPPSRDRKEKGRRRKNRTSASDSRRSACFILCLREPRAPATRTQPTRNRVRSHERDLSTPSRARTLKGARRESARGRQRKPLSPSPFFFLEANSIVASSPRAAALRPKERVPLLLRMHQARASRVRGRLERPRKGESARATGAEGPRLENSKCSQLLSSAHPTDRSLDCVSVSRLGGRLPPCLRPLRARVSRGVETRRRFAEADRARSAKWGDERGANIEHWPPAASVGAREEEATQPSTTSKVRASAGPRARVFLRLRAPPARVPREKERREQGTHLEKLRRREKKRKAKGEKKREKL